MANLRFRKTDDKFSVIEQMISEQISEKIGFLKFNNDRIRKQLQKISTIKR